MPEESEIEPGSAAAESVAQSPTTPAEAPEAATAPAPVAAAPPIAQSPTSPSSVASAPAGPTVRHNGRKVREGIVTSTSMDKTAIVTVTERVRHRLYRKTLQRSRKLYAHDEENTCRVGDRVRIAETRPLSKLKRWRLLEVVERAK